MENCEAKGGDKTQQNDQLGGLKKHGYVLYTTKDLTHNLI